MPRSLAVTGTMILSDGPVAAAGAAKAANIIIAAIVSRAFKNVGVWRVAAVCWWLIEGDGMKARSHAIKLLRPPASRYISGPF